MSRDLIGLLLLKVGTLLYGVITIYRIYVGTEPYLSALVLPAIIVLILWRLRSEGWCFLLVTFFLQFLYYSFCFVMELEFQGNHFVNIGKNVLLRGGPVIYFFAAMIFINYSKPLLVKHQHAQPISWSKSAALILLSMLFLFLPRIEQTIWTSFDPRILDNETEILDICFSPDGKKIGVINVGPTTAINVWDVETKKFISLLRSHREPQNSLAFSPDGKYVALGYGKAYDRRGYETKETVKVDLWELSSGKLIELKRTKPVEIEEDSHLQVSKVVFSPDSTQLACAAGGENVFIEIWNVSNGSLVKTFDTKRSGIASATFAYSPNGRYIATQYDFHEVAIWDIEAETTAFRLTEGYQGFINDIEYSSDGRFLAVAFDKKWPESKGGTEKGFIDIWDVGVGKIAKTLQWDSDAHINQLSYSPDGKYIAALLQLETLVNIWDVASGRQIETLTGPMYEKPITGIAYSLDGKYLAIANSHYIKLYNVRKSGE